MKILAARFEVRVKGKSNRVRYTLRTAYKMAAFYRAGQPDVLIVEHKS